eukprot:1010590-Prorocentrum_minimum.AAC.1
MDPHEDEDESSEDEDYNPEEVEDTKSRKRPRDDVKIEKGRNPLMKDTAEATAEEEEEEEKEKEDPQKKAKIDSLWNQLNAGSSSKAAKGGFSLAALCKPASKKKKVDDQSWMRSLGALGGARSSSKDDLRNAAKAALGTASKTLMVSTNSVGSIRAAGKGQTLGSDKGKIVAEENGKLVVTETRNFSGQQIAVTRTIAADSKEARKIKSTSGAGGIDAVLQQIEGKKKMNVLDKTKVDWGEYKSEQDVHVQEDLEKHKKSGDTLLEKKDFLQRADLKQYEIERDSRNAARKR